MRTKLLLKSISMLLLPLLLCAAHPFYLSVLELKYNTTEKSLQGSLRIFTNDLEKALTVQEKKKVDLINPTDKAAAKKIIETYLALNLKLEVDGKDLAYEVLGFEKIEESIWVYLESKCMQPKKIRILNSILCGSIKQQSNIMHVEVGGNQKSVKLDCPEKVGEFEF